MRPAPEQQTPDQAFQGTVVLSGAFAGSTVIYVVVGEIFAAIESPFEGYAELEDPGPLLLRVGLLALAAVVFAVVLTALRGEGILSQLTGSSRGEAVTAASLAGALQTQHILRIAMVESIAVGGLLLFLLAGNRLDLYLFAGIAIVGLLATWPRRAYWEDMYSRMARRHSGLPANPWRV
jgi:hypothetical protein